MQQRHGNGVARREKREILNADKVMHVMGYLHAERSGASTHAVGLVMLALEMTLGSIFK